MLQLNRIFSPHQQQKTAEGITLKLNQLLTAKILEIFPDQTAKIFYNGVTLHAKLEAPLTKGNRYLFEVTEKNGTVVLKKLEADPVKTTTEQILNKLTLPLNDTNKKAVDFSVSEKIPITKDHVKLVADILQMTSELPLKEKKEVVHRMLELQLPVKPDTVRAVIANVMKNTNNHSEMQQLFESLLPYIHKDKSIAKTVELLQGLFGFQNDQSKSKEGFQVSGLIKSDTGNLNKEISYQVVKQSLDTRGTVTENNSITENSKQEVKQSHLQLQRTEVSINEFKRQAANRFFHSVHRWLDKSGLLHEKNLLLDPMQLKQTETLKSQLMLLKQNAEYLELPENVMVKTEQGLTKITSQQLQNINTNDVMQQFLLQIPFGQDENPKEITIKWEGKKQNGTSLDPDHCRMLFWLDMKNLKDIAVDVQIQNRILSLKVYSEHPFIEKLSKAFVPSLKKSLNEMNYTLSSITFSQKPKNEVKSTESAAEYKGMDLRI
ncbi:hypothetical protein M3196_11005 [Fictibacillus nanhaiensis]|uniref:hypothetical protein n=1 Tax=Fictibacillus nanhaiensis TaxID=742169 RepID=UPI00203BCE8A|nr:hypothetical protein [Fictibacillus nanhaiensis]MCM3732186.1 hypothetical protein [Fictibacillus nanhaiensis]